MVSERIRPPFAVDHGGQRRHELDGLLVRPRAGLPQGAELLPELGVLQVLRTGDADRVVHVEVAGGVGLQRMPVLCSPRLPTALEGEAGPSLHGAALVERHPAFALSGSSPLRGETSPVISGSFSSSGPSPRPAGHTLPDPRRLCHLLPAHPRITQGNHEAVNGDRALRRLGRHWRKAPRARSAGGAYRRVSGLAMPRRIGRDAEGHSPGRHRSYIIFVCPLPAKRTRRGTRMEG